MFAYLQTLELLKQLPGRLAGLTMTALLGGALVAQGQTQPTFSCNSGNAYLFQKDATDVYELNLRTGNLAQKTFNGIKLNDGTSGAKYNAFGYNPVDNYIWGQAYNASNVVRIGSDFSGQSFPVTGLPPKPFVVGDISKTGIMYLAIGGSNSTADIYVIDLNNKTLSTTTLSTTLTVITDWAVSPIDNNLYAFDSNVGSNSGATKPTLYRFLTANRNNSDGTITAAGTRETLGQVTGGSPAISANNFGSAFMDSNGSFYGVINSSGAVYRIDNPQSLPINGSPSAIYVNTPSTPPNASNTDGARCALSAVPLPVQLTDFTASPAPNRAVRLAWETASELNNDHFEVQRSVDGRVFTAIGKVQGHGSAAQANSYGFTDAAPGGAATYYYRLRQVNIDGSFDFGPVRVVTLAAGSSPVQVAVAPNPSPAGSLHVQVQYAGPAPAAATLTLHSLLGQPVRSQAVTLQPGANSLRLDAAVAPGAYWLAVSGAGSTSRQGVRVLLTE